jgi:hypothetical protein
MLREGEQLGDGVRVLVVSGPCVEGGDVHFVGEFANVQALVRQPLVRQAKLGVSCRVKVPAEQGLTSHSYRVLQ